MAILLPQIDYTSRDYQSFKTDLLNIMASKLPEYSNLSESDFGVMLAELFCHLADSLSYYQDRQANEAFLPTVTLRSNMINLCKLIGYDLRNAVPSTVDITFVASGAGTVPAGTRVATSPTTLSPAVIFETDAAYTFGGGGSQNISCTQGETKPGYAVGFGGPLAVADGLANQEYALTDVGYIENTIKVYVDEGSGYVLWTQATDNNILNHGGTENVYQISVDADFRVSIRFGDGVNGRIVPLNAYVWAQQRIGGGTEGNVGIGTIVNLLDTLAFITSVTNAAAAAGGEDEESVDEARINGPASLKALNRAVTLEDYKALTLDYASVAKVGVMGTAGTPVKVDLFIVPVGGGTPSSSFLAGIVDYFSTRRMVGTIVSASVADYASVNMTFVVQVDSAYKNTSVEADVVSAITDYFAITSESRDLGAVVPISDIYALIEAIPGVMWVNISRFNITPLVTLDVPNWSFDSRLFDRTLAGGGTDTELTITMTSAVAFTVTGNVTGLQTNTGTVAAPYLNDIGDVGFTLNATNLTTGDVFTVKINTTDITHVTYTPVAFTYTFSAWVQNSGLVSEVWTVKHDNFIIDATNKFLDFNIGAAELNATITPGQYFAGATQADAGSLCKAIYDAIVAAEGVGTYTVSFAANKFTITRSAGTFQILWKTGVHGSDNLDTHIGTLAGYADTADDTGGLSYVSDSNVWDYSVTGSVSGNQSGGFLTATWLANAGANSGKFGFTLNGTLQTGDAFTIKNTGYADNISLDDHEYPILGTITDTYVGGY